MIHVNAPHPLGKYAVTINYYDDNMHHNIITGILVAKFMWFMNKTTVEWCSKKKDAVEITTYRSEHSSVRACVD